jgi:hypothetical protein
MISPRIQLPLFTALLFIVIASPDIFKFTNDALGEPLLRSRFIQLGGSPTKLGLVVHSIVFFLIMYLFTITRK